MSRLSGQIGSVHTCPCATGHSVVKACCGIYLVVTCDPPRDRPQGLIDSDNDHGMNIQQMYGFFALPGREKQPLGGPNYKSHILFHTIPKNSILDPYPSLCFPRNPEDLCRPKSANTLLLLSMGISRPFKTVNTCLLLQE